MAAWLGLLSSIGSLGAQAAGSASANASTIEGARTQAGIEAQNRAAQTRQFDQQIARQQPYVDVGKRALPDFINALSNRGDVSNLPATQIQGGMISDFLGPNAPDFIKDKALQNLNAVQLEGNKGRLSDLISIGLGGAGATTGSRLNLGSALGSSLSRQGNIESQGLQQSAQNRQNLANSLTTGLGGIPAYINTLYGGGGRNSGNRNNTFSDPFNEVAYNGPTYR